MSSDADRIVVVSGLPRSGTSLVMQMLATAGIPIFADDHRPADASNPRGYFEHAAVKSSRIDTAWVEKAAGHAVKVILTFLPNLPRDRHYDVLLMQRRLEDVVDSQNRMLERLGEPIVDLPSERLTEIFAWERDRARHLLEAEDCFRWRAVDFEALLTDPIAEAEGLLTFLDLDSPPGALAEVVDPALSQTRT